MDQGFDPEIKKYFRKIISSLSFGFLWLFANIIAGMYFGLAYSNGKLSAGTILYYGLSITGLAALLWYYYRLWRR